MNKHEIKDICAAGGNVIVSASNYNEYELKEIAISAKNNGVHLEIKQAKILSVYSCKSIVDAGGKRTVTFDFS